MMIDFEEEKGLFTFYREQAELEDQLKLQEKKLKKKKVLHQISEEKDKGQLDSVRSEEIMNHKSEYNQDVLRPNPQNRHKRKNPLSKRASDNSVIIVRAGESKITRSFLERKPLSMMIFDSKLREGKKNDFFVQKSEFTFKKNSHAVIQNERFSLQLRLSDLDVKHAESLLLNNSSHRNENMKIKLQRLKEAKQKLKAKKHRTERLSQSPKIASLPCDLPQIKEKKIAANRNHKIYPLTEKNQGTGIVKQLPSRNSYESLHMRKHRFFESQDHVKSRPEPTTIGGIIDIESSQKYEGNLGISQKDSAKLLEVLKRFKIGNTQIDLKSKELPKNRY